jgi:hypothetical protein
VEPPPTPPPPRPQDAYIGGKSCKKCHLKQYRAWSKSPLARSLATLRPSPADDPRAAAKRRVGLDPTKDYATDASCLPCHTTGHGARGGFPARPDASPEAAALAQAMGSVSCEACHGPGARYVAFKKARMLANRNAKFTFEELAPLGLVRPDASVCAGCHNARGPTHATDPFEFGRDRLKVHPQK